MNAMVTLTLPSDTEKQRDQDERPHKYSFARHGEATSHNLRVGVRRDPGISAPIPHFWLAQLPIAIDFVESEHMNKTALMSPIQWSTRNL